MYCVAAAVPGRTDFAWENALSLRLEAPVLPAWLYGLWTAAKGYAFALRRAVGLVNGEEHTIRVVIAPCTAYAGLNEYTGILSNAERNAAARHRQQADAERYRASRVLLRMALSSARADMAPQEWNFKETGHGKPVVAGNEQNAHFNISHTEAGLALALSRAPVGVDVEDLTREIDPSVYAAMLTPAEHRRLMRKRVATRSRHFLKIWAMKEAYAKLLGLGHSLDFAKIEVAPKLGHIVSDENFALETSHALSRSIRFHTFAWKQGQAEQWIAVAHQAPLAGRMRVQADVLSPAVPE